MELSHIYQDVGVSGTSGTNSRRGWHSLDTRLAQGDTLVIDGGHYVLLPACCRSVGSPKPIPRWDVHFGEIDDDRKDSTAPYITYRPQLGGHR